jgi:opine dehydrogenase
MRVAVLGGGHGAYATAADLALTGHRVRLWRRDERELAPLLETRTITLTAEGRQGAAELELATTDVREATSGADVVVVPLPATTHEDLARRLAGALDERQVVLLAPGTLGSYALARELGRQGARLPFAFAETGTLPYLTRKTGPAAVSAPVRAANLPVGVFPASRTKEALARVADLFPASRPCTDALDAALTNAGPVIHPPLVLLNAGAVDQGAFDVHAAGTTPSVRRLIDAVDGERVAARVDWGYPGPHYELATTYYDEARAGEGLYGAGAKAKLLASGLWSETVTLEHRYVREDVVLGLPLIESAGRAAGAATPATSGLLMVFGVLLGRALAGRGRALEALGLGDLSRREIRAFLYDGWTSPVWSRALR